MLTECQRATQPERATIISKLSNRILEELHGSSEARLHWIRGQLCKLCLAMLICTQPNLCLKDSVRHHIPKGTICPFLCIPSTPPTSSHSFRTISEVTFPCHQRSLPYPCPVSSVTLVTLQFSPIFLGVNFLIYKWPWTLPSSQLWSSNKLQLHLILHNALSLWSLASVQTSIASPSTQQLHEQMQSNIISYKYLQILSGAITSKKTNKKTSKC